MPPQFLAHAAQTGSTNPGPKLAGSNIRAIVRGGSARVSRVTIRIWLYLDILCKMEWSFMNNFMMNKLKTAN